MSPRKERSKQNKQAHSIAHREMIRSQNRLPDNVVDLEQYKAANMPNGRGMVSVHVQRRKRGPLTDEQCIDFVCELVAEGMNAKAARKHVGVPTTTWYQWRRENKFDLVKKYELAIETFLESMADDTIEVFEQLTIQRKEALRAHEDALLRYDEDLAAWMKQDKETRGVAPREPQYKGPSEMDLKVAQAKADIRKWHLERRHADYIDKQQLNNHTRISISQALKSDMSDEEALELYSKIINGQVVYSQ